ncbi:MAG: transglutaminase domain-containing protein [Phycisphaerae bacterium]|nr:transglutaminase domain-containing protein [Phycisphaerae bacterium]
MRVRSALACSLVLAALFALPGTSLGQVRPGVVPPPQNNPPPKKTAQPPAANSVLLQRQRTRDWTLTTFVKLQSFTVTTPDNAPPVVGTFNLARAAVLFPVNKSTGASLTVIDGVRGVLSFSGKQVDTTPEYNEGYPSGTRLGRWEVLNLDSRDLELKVEIPVQCWSVRFNEERANKLQWPQSGWPEEAASTLRPQMFVEFDDPAVRDLLKEWTGGKDPKSVLPVPLAKFLAGRVMEHVQLSGNGLTFTRSGEIAGLALQGAAAVAKSRKGSEHDLTCLLAAIYRAAGLPARTVIGYDIVDQEGKGDKFLSRNKGAAKIRSWIEFALVDDQSGELIWVPVDMVRQRNESSRAPNLNQPWPFFGNNDDLDLVIPFAFQFTPPTNVEYYGSPAFYGWSTDPAVIVATQTLRFLHFATPVKGGPTPAPPKKNR